MFLSFSVFDDFFRFSKKLGFWVFLVHPETTLPDGLETSGRRVYRYFGIFLDFFEFLGLDDFFCFSKQSGFGVFLVKNMVETTRPNGLETSGGRAYR